MNRTKTIAMFAAIFAIAMTTYGLSGSFASPMVMASISQTQDEMGILGHVEYTVLDSDQNVKAYLQADNVVVREGTDCAAVLIFGTTNSGACDLTANTFQYIGIGNGTAGATEDDIELVGSSCAINAPGELARKLVAPTMIGNAGSGTEVVLDVGTNTFKFDAANATTITQSGIFNNQFSVLDNTEPGGGMCSTYDTAGTSWEMFAVQDLGGGGVVVSDGDSLAVQWTITIS